jgi:phage terminase large subunit GpA-like protein
MKNSIRKRRTRTPPSSKSCAESLRRVFREGYRPPPRLTLSEWADRHAYLSKETSAGAGKFRSFSYQDGLMDAISDPSVTKITVMKSARIGFTTCVDHAIGYFLHQDPSPILLVLPRVEDAEDFSRSEVAPMLANTPVLRELTGELKGKDSNQRISKRVFRNGSSIAFIGANSPAGFRRITARIVLCDEIDGFPVAGAGDEGDQIILATKRSDTFWNRKIILGSTPTIKGASRVEKSFNESDQRRYHVPCPQCGARQVLRWANLRWDKGSNGEHLPETAHMVCDKGCVIEESTKEWMIDRGEWVASKPEVQGHAGFAIWAGYSLFPNASWSNLVSEFLRVKDDPQQLQTFVNVVLGETWEATADRVDGSSLVNRLENYGPESLPDEIRFLVAGTDTQSDRFETTVLGIGANDETWVVDHVIHLGDPAQQQLWVDYDHFLLGGYHTTSGRELRIRAVSIDAGGKWAQLVANFAQSRLGRRVYAIAGLASSQAATPIWPIRSSKTQHGQRIFMLNVNRAKELIYSRLRIEKSGPGFIHFPAGECFDQTYFEQLTSERILTKYRRGVPYRVWDLPSGKRNEALDCLTYAVAARHSIRNVRLDEMVQAPRASDPTPSPFPKPERPSVSIGRQLASVNSGVSRDNFASGGSTSEHRTVSFRRD